MGHLGPIDRSFALLGSGEFEPWTEHLDRWLLERARGDGLVLVAPTASAPEGDEVFEGWGRLGLAHYRRLGAPAEVLPLRTRADAEGPALSARLDDASMVFFSGGNPSYLAATLAGTRFWARLRERMVEGLALAGCSGGAAFLGERAPDSSLADPFTADLWMPGLGVFPSAVIAPHWDTLDDFAPGLRGWIGRAIEPELTLIGLEERTGLVGDGRSWRVDGEGAVHLRSGGVWSTHPSGAAFPDGTLTVL